MVRVFHCDDSTSFRALIRAELDGDPEIVLVGDAPDLDATLREVGDLAPDVVLLDLLDLDRDAVAEVAGVSPATQVIVLSGHPREFGEGRRGDAVAYVEKDAPLDELRAAVLRAAGG